MSQQLKYQVAVTVPLDEGDFCTVIGKMTHSPFLLAMDNAKIYDLDSNPVEVKDWWEDVYKRQL